MKKYLIKVLLILVVMFTTPVFAKAQTFQWAKSVGGSNGDVGYSIVADASGNAYTTGYFQGVVDFDPGPAVFNLISNGSNDIFILKLDAFGNFVWAKSLGGTLQDDGTSITVDALGNVYTTGNFGGTVDFDPGLGTYTLSANGSYDIFILKLDASGNFIWAKNMGGTLSDYGSVIATDATGNVYTTGGFNGTADFDPGAAVINLISSGSDEIFVSKLNSSGNFVWAKSMGGSSQDIGMSICVDAAGNVYTTGVYNGVADFDPGISAFNLTSAGSIDIFVSKLDAAGNFIWAKSMGGSSTDLAKSIAIEPSGNVYTTGYFAGLAEFDPGPGTYTLVSAGGFNEDIFISKLDPSGNFVWAKSIGGNQSDRSNSISLDPSGNIYTTGYFCGSADFDPGVGTFSLTAIGTTDIFISKLNSLGNFISAKGMGGTVYNGGQSIYVDGSYNIYTAGIFDGTTDFDPDGGTYSLTPVGASDVFIHKMIQPTTVIESKNTINENKIYPNPTREILKIETKNENGEMILINSLGEKIHGQILERGINNINIKMYPIGIYHYIIIQNGVSIESGKVLID